LPSFKVIPTTRPQPHIRVSPDIQKFFLQGIDEKGVDAGIRLYLKHIHFSKQVFHSSADTEEIDSLVRGADALSIVASCEYTFHSGHKSP